ncbi:TPA: type II toxin-antitoxin system RelB/DinJ family antitoxin [Streptococcus suis]|nr:type II toxin-antitoxin system RelB/DinJ family antitoxin [Streptococcus suis]
MATLTRDRQYNFRVNAEMLDKAKSVLEAKNISVPDALNLFVERVVEEQDLPIKTAEQVRAATFLAELQSELNEGYQDVVAGRTKPASEVFAQYGL